MSLRRRRVLPREGPRGLGESGCGQTINAVSAQLAPVRLGGLLPKRCKSGQNWRQGLSALGAALPLLQRGDSVMERSAPGPGAHELVLSNLSPSAAQRRLALVVV